MRKGLQFGLLILLTAGSCLACSYDCRPSVVANDLDGYVWWKKEAAANQKVEIYRTTQCSFKKGKTFKSVKTDDSGYFKIGKIPPGDYLLTVSSHDGDKERHLKVVTLPREISTYAFIETYKGETCDLGVRWNFDVHSKAHYY